MNLKIAKLSGDGIGPEVIEQGVKVVNAIAKKFNHSIIWTEALVGASSIEEEGDPYPDKTHKICMQADAILFGAIGDPKYDDNPLSPIRPEQGLLAMRKKLGLYANIRPILTFPSLINNSPLQKKIVERVNFICIRELSSGIYFGDKGRKDNGKTSYDVCIYTYEEVEKILLLAYQYSMKRNKKLCVVDKANVLETSRLWREVSQNLEKKFPKVKVEYLFVDAAAMKIIQNPSDFDVIVTDNMFGDILTDEASVISGSMGLMPSASIGKFTPIFEPIHGSYPQVAGKNIANPIGTILSVAMMFDEFNLYLEASRIREVVNESIEKGVVTLDIGYQKNKSFSTSEVGDWISNTI